MEIRPSTGLAHGVFLLNSNGMDVNIFPGGLTYRVIGGTRTIAVILTASSIVGHTLLRRYS
jgi:hypothetical protein